MPQTKRQKKPKGPVLPKSERLFALMAFLLKSRNPVPKETIRMTCDTYKQAANRTFDRVFARDREELRRSGIPVKLCRIDDRREIDPTDAANHRPEDIGYWIDPRECFMPQLDLEADEWLALRVIGGALARGKHPTELQSVWQKLECQPGHESGPGRKPDVAMALGHRADAALDAQNLPVLMGALRENRRVSFNYHGLGHGPDGNRPTKREVDIYNLVLHYGAWYAAGFCRLRRALRVFKVSRMSGIRVLRETYETPKDFDSKDLIGCKAWEFAVGPDCGVKLEAKKEDAWLIRAELGENAKWAGNEAELVVRNAGPFIRWAAANCDRVRILEPAWMAEGVARHLEEVREVYRHA